MLGNLQIRLHPVINVQSDVLPLGIRTLRQRHAYVLAHKFWTCLLEAQWQLMFNSRPVSV